MKPTIWNIKANNNKWYPFRTLLQSEAIIKFKNKFPSLIPVFVEEEKERKENELTE